MIKDNIDMEVSKALNILSDIGEQYRYDKICELNDDQRQTYSELLLEFKRLHDIPNNSSNMNSNLHNLKGEALENLVSYLLKISGGIFCVSRNLRNTSNEIDEIISLNNKGKMLLKYNLINSNLESFLGECKNYDGTVSVTYVGKFCSLLLTNSIKLGIMFSYNGVSGIGWSYGTGLIKKFYLHKEDIQNRYCIINFTYKDFEDILNGKNLLQIIDEQLKSLQFDTDYSHFLSKHPAE